MDFYANKLGLANGYNFGSDLMVAGIKVLAVCLKVYRGVDGQPKKQ
jgi:hypothetical protein